MKICAYMTFMDINKRAYTQTFGVIKLITKMALVFRFSWSAFPLIMGCSSKGSRTKTKKLDGKKLNFTQGASCWRTLIILPSYLSEDFLIMDVGFYILFYEFHVSIGLFQNYELKYGGSLSALTNVSFGPHQFSENRFRQSSRTGVDEAHFNILFLFHTKLKWTKFHIAFCLPKPWKNSSLENRFGSKARTLG